SLSDIPSRLREPLPNMPDKFKVLVPRRSLYIQRDDLRYHYSHEIPTIGHPDHSIDGQLVHRDRRLVILLRDQK
ncbi:hypothetical protein HDU91_003756, partial [Kappamyces sp. JEL0680]